MKQRAAKRSGAWRRASGGWRRVALGQRAGSGASFGARPRSGRVMEAWAAGEDRVGIARPGCGDARRLWERDAGGGRVAGAGWVSAARLACRVRADEDGDGFEVEGLGEHVDEVDFGELVAGG